MKTINFCFRIHQRFNLKRYRFFEIGNDHYYYDDYANETAIRYTADNCYLEANRVLLDMIRSSNGKFKVSFSISGLALEQLEQYAPEVIESFQELAKTGSVEFLATPYGHSLAAMYNEDEFGEQVKMQANKIKELFGKKPTVFANSALLYSDEIGEMIANLGYKNIVVEGAKHVLGWKSPNYLYSHAYNNKIKLLVRNNKLSDDINYRFSNWTWDQYPLTAEKFIGWIKESPAAENIFTVFMGYEALGVLNNKNSGIFEFFKALPFHAMEQGVGFALPSEICEKNKPVDTLTALYPMSWTDEEKDVSAWCGNELQNEALSKLYNLAERVHLCSDTLLKVDWQRLQDTAHFYFMTTKHYSDGMIYAQKIPYESPYEAFMNYMNVLSDFIERVNAQYPTSIENEELNALLKTIRNQEEVIEHLEKKVKTQKKITETTTKKK
ncbi:MAG: glycoside hydrolase family 57 protein [Paludibacteraceae bacterium]|jgi:alpha-amylase|nr:glycoside hydrolase family 57 protein [Paludibacteraceae bacterium]